MPEAELGISRSDVPYLHRILPWAMLLNSVALAVVVCVEGGPLRPGIIEAVIGIVCAIPAGLTAGRLDQDYIEQVSELTAESRWLKYVGFSADGMNRSFDVGLVFLAGGIVAAGLGFVIQLLAPHLPWPWTAAALASASQRSAEDAVSAVLSAYGLTFLFVWSMHLVLWCRGLGRSSVR